MNNLADRLLEVMRELDLAKPKDLADFCGVSEGLVSQWFSGRTKLGPKPLRAFARTQFNLDWITDGRAPKYRDSQLPQGFRRVEASDPEDEHPELVKIQRVRLRLSAGLTGFQTDPDRRSGGIDLVPRRWIERHGYIAERLLAIEVHGESMEPSLYDGDTVVINTADTRPVDGSVYAINHDGEAVVKRLEKEGPLWYLASDNKRPEFGRRMIRDPSTWIIGRVVRKESERI